MAGGRSWPASKLENNMTLEISHQEYVEFRDELERISGIKLGDGKEYLISSRLRRMMQDDGLKRIGDLLHSMRSNSGLREKVIDSMTTNETLWFRDEHPYRIFRDRLLPELDQQRKPVRIWSAACSTGQEPYSLAIEMEEFRKKNPSSQAGNGRILATDISQSALKNAKDGCYPQLAIWRGMSEQHLKNYFHPQEGEFWQIDDRIRKRVEFRNQNLQQSFSGLGKFDVIFCRNVLIYFSADLKMDILRRLHSCLNPGGYLILGASESLSNQADLYEMVNCSPGIIYRAKTPFGG